MRDQDRVEILVCRVGWRLGVVSVSLGAILEGTKVGRGKERESRGTLWHSNIQIRLHLSAPYSFVLNMVETFYASSVPEHSMSQEENVHDRSTTV